MGTDDARQPQPPANRPVGRTRVPLPGPAFLAGVVVALVVPLVAVVVLVVASGPTTYRYTVPAGTGERQDRGEVVEIMPTELHLDVGDHLVIVNEDDRVQTVGLFTVRPGETVDTPFGQPGVFKGACTMSASGQIVITVT